MATTTRTRRPFRLRRLSVADYLRMIEVGILTEKDRVFLGAVSLMEVWASCFASSPFRTWR
jgi:hypothetical protein